MLLEVIESHGAPDCGVRLVQCRGGVIRELKPVGYFGSWHAFDKVGCYPSCMCAMHAM